MKRKHHLKLRKRYVIPALIAFGLGIYLIFAYNYFFNKIHSAHLGWPNNQRVYQFNESSPSKMVYVTLGDSLTFGVGTDKYEDSYTYQVAKSMSADGNGIILKDLSYPGLRTSDVLKRLDMAIASNPDVITVFIGVNDTHALGQPRDFTKNYDQLLNRLTHETKAKIYVINLPYLGAKSILLPPYNYYFDAKTRAHNADIKGLAEKYNVGYIDLYSQTVDLFKKDGSHYSKDFYHPSAVGYKIWAKIIANGIHQ